MSSVIDLSLEDIIQRKKQTRANMGNRSKVKIAHKSGNLKPKALPVNAARIDARNKIISKKRTQLTDARERLAQLAKQKDARLKLEQIRQKKMMMTRVGRNSSRNLNYKEIRQPRTYHNDGFGIVSKSREIRTNPMYSSGEIVKSNIIKKFVENRCVEARPKGRTPYLKPILRTVENDSVVMDIDDDSMEDDYETNKIISSNRKSALNFKITARNSNAHSRNDISERSYRPRVREERSPPRLTSILKKRPMAALRTEPKPEKREIPISHPTEYRIIVSNLRSSVTAGDIEELFGDIGNMQESRLVRPGTAEVIYKSLEDAQRAVDLYHNRQLDGQPMNCLLVTPRAQTSSFRSSSKHSLPPSTSSNVEPDISTFHKVLFSSV